jgi:hypothetical protein
MATELLNDLVAPCRYDQWASPRNKSGPLQVGVRMHVYFLGAIEAQSLVSDVIHSSYGMIDFVPHSLHCQVISNVAD